MEISQTGEHHSSSARLQPNIKVTLHAKMAMCDSQRCPLNLCLIKSMFTIFIFDGGFLQKLLAHFCLQANTEIKHF